MVSLPTSAKSSRGKSALNAASGLGLPTSAHATAASIHLFGWSNVPKGQNQQQHVCCRGQGVRMRSPGKLHTVLAGIGIVRPGKAGTEERGKRR